MSYKDGVTAYKIKNILWRIKDKKYLTGINKEATCTFLVKNRKAIHRFIRERMPKFVHISSENQ
jgi:hypothetical protein